MTPSERRSVILEHHESLHSLSKKIAVKQEGIVLAIQTGFTESPKLAAECKRISVDVVAAKRGRHWRHYRTEAGNGIRLF